MYAIYTSLLESMRIVQGYAIMLDCARLQRPSLARAVNVEDRGEQYLGLQSRP